MKASELLQRAAKGALDELDRRRYDLNHRFSEQLLSHLLVHEALVSTPSISDRLWLEYRPWPGEGEQRIDIWTDGDGSEPTFAVELKVADPTPEAKVEDTTIRGEVVSDCLKLATAIRGSGLDEAYVVLCGRSICEGTDTALSRLLMASAGHEMIATPEELIPTPAEQKACGLADWMQDPDVPRTLKLRLQYRGAKSESSCWLVQVWPA